MNQIENIIDSLQVGKTAILCGAGISRPSGLPTVDDFYHVFLNYLFDNEDIEYIINLIYEYKIPFEKIMELVLNATDCDARMFEIFSNGEPNENHYIISSLFANNHIADIYTTNFDCLIEKAINSNGKIRYSKYINESDFTRLCKDKMAKKLIKLHGSTDDINSIRITLSTLTASSLNKQRVIPIEQLFKYGSHETIIVIGYSFSDVFDVNPVIESLGKLDKTVIVIEHSNNFGGLEKLTIKEPFLKITCPGFRLTMDTTLFLRLFYEKTSKRIICKPPTAQFNPKFDWAHHLDDTIGELDAVTKHYLAGRLWSILRHYENAAVCYEAAYKFVNVQYAHPKYVNIVDNMVSAKMFAGCKKENKDTLLHICKTALQVVDTERKHFLTIENFYDEKARLKYRIGRLNEDNVDDTASTLRLYYSSYRLYAYSGNVKGIAAVFHQLAKVYGIILHDTKMGLKIQRKNRDLCSNMGYISWEARINAAMAEICDQSESSSYREQAKYYRSEAKKLLKVGEIDLFVSDSMNQAIIYMNEGDYVTAEAVLVDIQNKYPVSKLTGAYQAAILFNLAKCRVRLNKMSDAFSNITDAELTYASYTQNKHDILQCKQERAIILLILGHSAQCFELLSSIEKDILTSSADNKGHYYFYRALCHLTMDDFGYERWNELAYTTFRNAGQLSLYATLCGEYATILGIYIPRYNGD